MNPQKFCENWRSVIQSDKPVYKIGETAQIYIYNYDLFKKQPLSKCQDNKFFSIEILDGEDKNVGYFERENNEEKDSNIDDFSTFVI